MLPGLSGFDVCRELRGGERTRDIPIIILTAKAEETDQVVGFSLGADDYVTKPFSVKVLLQRIKALQRRIEGVTDPVDVIEHLDVRHRPRASPGLRRRPRAGPDADGVPPAGVPAAPAGPGLHAPPADGRRHRRRRHRAGAHH